MLKLDFFLVFVLAHLIGDYVLQTNKIARLKATAMKGLIMHCVIITAVQVVLLSFFGFKGIAAGFLCGIVHFFLDYLKSLLHNVFKNIQFIYYILDQVLHLTAIALFTLAFAPETGLPDGWLPYVKILISVAVLTFMSTVTVKMLLRDLYRNMLKEVFFRRHERIFDAAAALTLWGILFLPVPWTGVAVLAVLLAYWRYQKSILAYSLNIILVKFVSYFIISCLVYLI